MLLFCFREVKYLNVYLILLMSIFHCWIDTIKLLIMKKPYRASGPLGSTQGTIFIWFHTNNYHYEVDHPIWVFEYICAIFEYLLLEYLNQILKHKHGKMSVPIFIYRIWFGYEQYIGTINSETPMRNNNC